MKDDSDNDERKGFNFWAFVTNFRFIIGVFILVLFLMQKCSG